MQDQTIYVAGHTSEVAEAREQVYAYDVSTDHWRELPIPGQYYGIPHIIGGKLSIIGGRLSDTRKKTDRVLTLILMKQLMLGFLTIQTCCLQ